ncbi:glycerophosphodiester phosphodiesterase [Halobacterium yunchengense]|uniref:glycerophosphodiester phosphodiesterase n=1 Tax=Halobacterium yunchengense TaxID=3108497 RepID=UPI00300853C1
MEHIAHRGCAGQYPENTRRAVRESAPHVDRVEVDVRRCGSGELVVHHADDLSVKTDGEGRVHASALSTLRDVDVLGSGEGVPRFDEVLADVPPSVDVQVDLKHEGLAADVADALAAAPNDAVLCSTDRSVLADAAAGSLPFGLVSFAYFETRPVSDEEVARVEYESVVAAAADLGCAFVEAPAKLCRQTAFVSTAHDAGLDVVAWPVDSRDAAAALRDAGVDGLMLDRHDVLGDGGE